MNLPTKLTVGRVLLAIVVMAILIFPFEAIGINLPVLRLKVDIDIRYIIVSKCSPCGSDTYSCLRRTWI